jgi:hypothetical protein
MSLKNLIELSIRSASSVISSLNLVKRLASDALPARKQTPRAIKRIISTFQHACEASSILGSHSLKLNLDSIVIGV